VTKIIDATAKNVKSEVLGKGKQAFRLLGLRPADPEITELVGRLCFRTSYTQNQWEHVVEVSYLAGLMASELDLNVKLARRAGLLHDIGKALTHEVEGSHALIGAEIAERLGEAPEVIGAIGEHHAEKPTSSVYTLLVGAADAISGARPGARKELVETYGERIAVLEDLASAFRGVQRVHAVQAGREVRILVDEKKIDDQRAGELAAEIAQKISDELSFPGQIQVTVIREFAAQEFAN
jgi:ribonuclease Y